AETLDVTWTEQTYRIHEVPLERKPPLQDAINFYHPDDRDRLSQAIQRALEHGEPYDMERRFITTTGKRLWVRTICSPQVVDGKTIKLIGMFQDITERKQAEEALQESERNLKNAQTTAHLGSWKLDTATMKVTGSDELFSIFGLSREEATLESFVEIVHPDDREYDVTHIQRGLELGEPWDIEHRLILRDGTQKWVHAIGEAIKDESGKIISLSGITQDITERKQAEETLRASKEIQDAILSSTDVLLAYLDREFNFIAVNQAYADAGRRHREDFIGQNHFELYPHEENQALFESVIETGTPLHITAKPFEHPDQPERGTTYWNWSLIPIKDESGSVQSLVFSVLDVTELVRAKEALQHAKDSAETANRAKSIFLANMSHELRTPLNAVLGFSQLLSHSSNLESEQQEQIDAIRRGGEHLLTLINDVLDLSKIEAGRITLDETTVDVHRLCDELWHMFRLRAQAKGVQIHLERPPDVPRYVRTDEVKLRQVLINLLSNAIKFTEEGRVTLHVTKVTNVEEFPSLRQAQDTAWEGLGVGSQSHISHLKFTISDTGPGIASGEVETIFDAFVQAEIGRNAHEGTGLGLAISRTFVQAMGGNLRVESEVGRGATFTFEIPVGLVDQSTITNQQSPISSRVIAVEPNQPDYRILIVDDNQANRQLLVNLLQPLDFELREAEHGQDALEIWKDWQPHLIWMDLKMPVMDGYEATKRIRAAEAARNEELRPVLSDVEGMRNDDTSPKHQTPNTKHNTRIIAVTAYAFQEEKTRALAQGCDDVLSKPFREAEVFKLLATHLGVSFVYAEAPQSPIPSAECILNGAAGLRTGSNRQSPIKEGVTPEALAALPEEWLTALRDAADETDPSAANVVIQRIREQDEPLADALAALVKTYRFDIVQELLIEN
ncbi:MAG: PAS domain S-box protein, partial [Planctomycetaceae bacterium]|nr:PAS domain S-box protein [Planctomycetaceae bacterium]